ncbi:hypothetical protein DMA11_10070 [Marinilabiliaceae bacterium JC017]|nr:hypothetical protein DMA11_10070 [Marinilabiliaceae bacterium JC017]
MKRYLVRILVFIACLAPVQDVLSQTTTFLQENFDGKKRADLVSLGWTFSNNNNSAVEVADDALKLKSQGFYCTPVINELVTDYDQVIISFRYKNPKPTYGSADKLEVIVAEDYYWSSLQGEQVPVLTSEACDNWRFASFVLDGWNPNQFLVCFKYSSRGGLDIYIEDVVINGVNITPGALPGVNIDASRRIVFEEDQVQLFDLSTEVPNSFEWSVSGVEGVDWDFVAPSSKNTQNPEIIFHNQGFYDVTLKATNVNGVSSQTFSGFITVSCPAQSNDFNNGHISRVRIPGSSLDNSTGVSAYSSFFDLAPELDLSSSFDLEVTASSLGWAFTGGGSINCRAWLDWDQDGFYDDGYRDLVLSKSGNDYSGMVTIIPPLSVAPGLVNMRIKLANDPGDVTDACGNVATGEVEDYAINFFSGEVTELLGNCLVFNGGYAETNGSVLPANTSQFTMEAWVFVANASGDKGFFGQSGNIELGLKNNQLNLWTEAGEVSVPWNYTNQWVHIAATGDASSLNLYVNGALKGTTAVAANHINVAATDFRMADGVLVDVATDNAFIGRLDELRIWDVVRSEAEILQNMYETIPAAQTNLRAYYQFNEATVGDQVKDWKGLYHADLYMVAENYLVSSVPYLWSSAPVDNSCTNGLNWSWGSTEIPRAGNKAIIPQGGVPQISNGELLTFGALELQPGAHFAIQQGGQLSLNDSLVIKNSIDNLASLVEESNLVVPANATTISMDYLNLRFWYIGHDVDGGTSGDYQAADADFMRMWYYDGNWIPISDNTMAFDEPLKGYHLLFRYPTTVTQKGDLRSGDYSLTGLPQGWHLMGNPYPSYLDLTLEQTVPGVHWEFTNVRKFIYNRTKIGLEYVVVIYDIQNPILSHPEASSTIAPMQGFWVWSDGAGVLGVKNTARTHGSGQLKSAAVAPDNVIKLTLGNQYGYDYVAIAFNPNGEAASLTGNDAEKMFSTGEKLPQLYMKKAQAAVAINVLPALESEATVNIYHSIGSEAAGEHALKVINIEDFDPMVSVRLEDKVTGQWINLRESPEYTFEASAVADEQRFVLHLSKLADSLPASSAPTNVVVYGNEGAITVRLPEEAGASEAEVAIYSIEGKELTRNSVFSNEITFNVPKVNQTYLVKVKIANAESSHKVFVP